MDSEAKAKSGPLRVSIFPYIPDLADDELCTLKGFIKKEFELQTGIEVSVESSADPYDLPTVKQKHLSSKHESYDVMEIDTIVLGELAKAECIAPFSSLTDLESGDNNMLPKFFPWCVESVTFQGEIYGMPTLQCASFLMELASGAHSAICTRPILRDWQAFSNLSAAIESHQKTTGHRILLAGDFRGSWGLPMLYLDACVDKSGTPNVYEGIDAPIDDPELIENLKEFTDLGKLDAGTNPDTDTTFHKDHKALVSEAVESKHILVYGYSENLSEILLEAGRKRKHLRVLNIGSTPLDRVNNLITYTDALVVNRSTCNDPVKSLQIQKFIKFYTSLDFRKKFAFGYDLPQQVRDILPARYVLPALVDFYSTPEASRIHHYKQLHALLVEHSIAAPNHDVYKHLEQLESTLERLLGFKRGSKTQLM